MFSCIPAEHYQQKSRFKTQLRRLPAKLIADAYGIFMRKHRLLQRPLGSRQTDAGHLRCPGGKGQFSSGHLINLPGAGPEHGQTVLCIHQPRMLMPACAPAEQFQIADHVIGTSAQRARHDEGMKSPLSALFNAYFHIRVILVYRQAEHFRIRDRPVPHGIKIPQTCVKEKKMEALKNQID